jgi:hypothetical protein
MPRHRYDWFTAQFVNAVPMTKLAAIRTELEARLGTRRGIEISKRRSRE